MVSVKEMLIGNVKEEAEGKIDIKNFSPFLPVISSSDEECMPK
jgi:hypothetical protein